MIEHCCMCGEIFAEDMIIQDETWNTYYSDEQATLMDNDWYSDDEGTVLCPDCMRELDTAGYDYWAWKYYLADRQGIDSAAFC